LAQPSSVKGKRLRTFVPPMTIDVGRVPPPV
jgi:hypothetical protein